MVKNAKDFMLNICEYICFINSIKTENDILRYATVVFVLELVFALAEVVGRLYLVGFNGLWGLRMVPSSIAR